METSFPEIDLQTTKEIASLIYNTLEDRQAEEIRILDIHEISVLTDFFIIATARNANHVRALLDSVEDKLAEAGYEPNGREGMDSFSWALLDYNHVVLHVFNEEARHFYDLERIWKDGKEIEPSDLN